jgi:hypothetical protein
MKGLIDRFGDLFQLSYVTRDRDAAVEFARAKLGIDNFYLFDGISPVVSRGEHQELRLRAAVANVGTHQFEILEPIGGPTWIYTDGRDMNAALLQLHHVGLAVMGPYSAWEETIARIEADGDEIVQIAAVAPDEEPQALFAYVDNRETLGHFTEYLWWTPRLDGMPTFPFLQQGAPA